MRYPNPTPAHPGLARDQARHAWRRPQRQGHARTFPFPNPEAKTASADGTAPARVWESRTPPPAHHKGGARHGPPLSRAHTTAHTGHTGHTATPAARKHRPSAHRPHSHTHRPHGQATHTAKLATPRPILEHRVWASPSRAQSRRTQPNTRTQVDAVGYETCV